MKSMEAFNKKQKLRLVIEHDEPAGFYLIVYLCGSDKSIADYLCDSLEEAFFEAEDRYNVSPESWKIIKKAGVTH